MATSSPKIPKIFIAGAIRRYTRTGRCGFCTDLEIAFLGSLHLQLPFNINFALVQTRYHGKKQPQNSENFHCWRDTALMTRDTLLTRTGRCGFCTDQEIAFLGSPHPQLPYNVNIALVQTRYLVKRQPRNFENFYCLPNTALQDTGQFVDPYRLVRFCTDQEIEFLGSPYLQLPFNINFQQVQTWYHGKSSPKIPKIFIAGVIWCYTRTGRCGFCTDLEIAFLGSLHSQLPFNINFALVHTRYYGERQHQNDENFHS